MNVENCLKRFTEEKILCFKYNQSLDAIVQNFSCYEGYIKIEGTDELLIMCKKPINEPEYVLEADASEIQNIRDAKKMDYEASKKDFKTFE
jgi:hypothetical protein